MPGDKQLLKTHSVEDSGRLHSCRRQRDHRLPKGATMLVVTEGYEHHHYCPACGLRFIDAARLALSELETRLQTD